MKRQRATKREDEPPPRAKRAIKKETDGDVSTRPKLPKTRAPPPKVAPVTKKRTPPKVATVVKKPAPHKVAAVAKNPAPHKVAAVAKKPAPPKVAAVAKNPAPHKEAAVAKKTAPPKVAAVAKKPAPPKVAAVAKKPAPPKVGSIAKTRAPPPKVGARKRRNSLSLRPKSSVTTVTRRHKVEDALPLPTAANDDSCIAAPQLSACRIEHHVNRAKEEEPTVWDDSPILCVSRQVVSISNIVESISAPATSKNVPSNTHSRATRSANDEMHHVLSSARLSSQPPIEPFCDQIKSASQDSPLPVATRRAPGSQDMPLPVATRNAPGSPSCERTDVLMLGQNTLREELSDACAIPADMFAEDVCEEVMLTTPSSSESTLAVLRTAHPSCCSTLPAEDEPDIILPFLEDPPEIGTLPAEDEADILPFLEDPPEIGTLPAEDESDILPFLEDPPEIGTLPVEDEADILSFLEDPPKIGKLPAEDEADILSFLEDPPKIGTLPAEDEADIFSFLEDPPEIRTVPAEDEPDIVFHFADELQSIDAQSVTEDLHNDGRVSVEYLKNAEARLSTLLEEIPPPSNDGTSADESVPPEPEADDTFRKAFQCGTGFAFLNMSAHKAEVRSRITDQGHKLVKEFLDKKDQAEEARRSALAFVEAELRAVCALEGTEDFDRVLLYFKGCLLTEVERKQKLSQIRQWFANCAKTETKEVLDKALAELRKNLKFSDFLLTQSECDRICILATNYHAQFINNIATPCAVGAAQMAKASATCVGTMASCEFSNNIAIPCALGTTPIAKASTTCVREVTSCEGSVKDTADVITQTSWRPHYSPSRIRYEESRERRYARRRRLLQEDAPPDPCNASASWGAGARKHDKPPNASATQPHIPKKGDMMYRRGHKCEVIFVDNSLDPPSFTVRMVDTSNEVNCDGDALERCSAIDQTPVNAATSHRGRTTTCSHNLTRSPKNTNDLRAPLSNPTEAHGDFPDPFYSRGTAASTDPHTPLLSNFNTAHTNPQSRLPFKYDTASMDPHTPLLSNFDTAHTTSQSQFPFKHGAASTDPHTPLPSNCGMAHIDPWIPSPRRMFNRSKVTSATPLALSNPCANFNTRPREQTISLECRSRAAGANAGTPEYQPNFVPAHDGSNAGTPEYEPNFDKFTWNSAAGM